MKKLLIILCLALNTAQPLIFAQDAAASTELALAERRGVKEYQEKVWPEVKKKLDEAAGFDVTVDIAWNTIAIKGQADSYSNPEFWTNIYFVPLTNALKSIAKDEDGKNALKAKLKKIIIKLDPDTAPASNYVNGLKFESGELHINWTPYSNVDHVEDRTKALIETVEAKL